MGLFRWFTTNWANTTEPTHTDLTPLVLPLSPAEAIERVRFVAAGLPSWRVESADDGVLHLTRRTRVFGFVDDVVLRFVPAGPGTLIHAESKSRVGVGDLGQNRRNILELFSAVRRSTLSDAERR
jgi:uncharacterized protein (DUF1499 family)